MRVSGKDRMELSHIRLSNGSSSNNSSSSSIGSGGGGREINIAVLGSKGVGKSGEYDDGHHGDSEQDVNY